MTVDEAQSKINSRQFVEYIAYFEMYPPISTRADINSALIRRTIIACNAQKTSDIPDLEKLMINYHESAMKGLVKNEIDITSMYKKACNYAMQRNLNLKKNN